MSLVERITQALNVALRDGWQAWEGFGGDWIVGRYPARQEGSEMPVAWGQVAEDIPDEDTARLIAEAPGLLAECAQRLHTTADVADLIDYLRLCGRDGIPPTNWRLLDAVDLLEQVFLDPQESRD